MKTFTCKRCNTQNLLWRQNSNGKWFLVDSEAKEHFCSEETLKAVKCKYCNADDLHWAEEIDPISKNKKMLLTESYGLPHACDERLAFVAAEKLRKKEEYSKAKTHVESQPNGKCSGCEGTGRSTSLALLMPGGICNNCYGWGTFSPHAKRAILARIRDVLWPGMPTKYTKRY